MNGYPSTAIEADAPQARSRFRIRGLRWWIAILLMGVTIINYLDRSCLSVAAPTLKKVLSINEVDFSHVIMAFQIAYLVMQPIAGRLIDWLNIRKGFTLSIIAWSIAQALTSLASGWRSFAFFRVLLGAGEAGNFPGVAKTISQWFRPQERTVAMGIINVGSSMGALIAPPLVVFLILKFNWQTAFVVTGLLGFVWLILWRLLYYPRDEHPMITPEELAYIREGQESHDVVETPHRGVWKVVLPQKNFWALAMARFLSEPAWQFFTYWIPMYLATERHMKLKEIGYFAWLPFLAADLGCLFGGMLSPFFLRFRVSVLTARKLSASVCALLMVGAIFIGRAPSAPWAIFYFCIGAFAHQAMSSTLLTLPADLFPKSTVATANGLSGTMGGLGGMLFTLVIGIVAMKIGYGPLFIAIAFFDIIGVCFLWTLMRTPSGPAPLATQNR